MSLWQTLTLDVPMTDGQKWLLVFSASMLVVAVVKVWIDSKERKS